MPTLAVDLGGTKTLATLVEGATVLEERLIATDRAADPDVWLSDIAQAADGWAFSALAIAVTGRVDDGLWTSLNSRTLAIPDRYPLAVRAAEVFGMDPLLVNDAQAAAYGEFRHGAGRNEDMIFLTVSTGLGGGIVTGGRLWTGAHGLAGHVGQMRGQGAAPLEEHLSGTALRTRAAELGRDLAGPEIVALADREDWARSLLDDSARALADHCCDLQLLVDPRRIVIGGGLGIASGYLDRVRDFVSERDTPAPPDLHQSVLRECAGVIGAAALEFDRRCSDP